MAKTLSFAGINVVLQSRIAYLFVGDNKNEIKERIGLSMEYILFMGLGLSFGIIGVSNKFVPWFFFLYFNKTIVLLQLMSPLVVIIGISNCLGSQYYTPAGLRAQSAKYIIVGSIINLLCNLVLIPKYMGFGAAVATLIAEITITLLYMRNNNGYYTFGGLCKQVWKKIVAGALMCFAMLIVGKHTDKFFIAILIEFFIGSSVYILTLFALKDRFVKSIAIPSIRTFFKKNRSYKDL